MPCNARNLTLAVAVLMTSGTVVAPWPLHAAQRQDRLAEAFSNPPKSARPEVRWWWPGNAVDDQELQREIAVLDSAGFGGAEIQSFNPGIPDLTTEERAAVGGYATPSFFGHVRTAVEAARMHGLMIDYTLGSSWPSGGGTAITPEKALLELSMAVTPVSGGGAGDVKVAIPERTKRMGAFSTFDPWTRSDEGKQWRERFDARARIVSVMAYKGTQPTLAEKPKSPLQLSPWSDVRQSGAIDLASRIDLTGKVKADGTLDWKAPAGNWLVFVFKQYASNNGVMGAAGSGPQLVLDHYEKRAFDAHVARVGAPLVQALGKLQGLRATFVDSLELFQDLPWSEDFLAEFRKRRGYDLSPYLPFIVQPGWMQAWDAHYSPPYFQAAKDGDLADRVRADYRQTVSDLMIDNFLKPFVAWNHANGLKAKFQAHGGPLDTLQGYGLADIPETEDLHDGANPYFMRLARSAADIYGRPTVSAESMVWANRPFSVTPDEMRRRADLLAASGVNAQTVHGFTYRLHEEKWPGWFAFQPNAFTGGFSSMLQESDPIWAAVPGLTAYMTRLNAIMQQGSNVVPAAMFLGDIGFYDGMDGKGRVGPNREKQLLENGYDYDRINADGLNGSRVEGRQLVTSGGHAYSVLILPALASLRAETAEKVAGFAEQGLAVLFTANVPSRETGLFDHNARDARVKAAMARVFAAGGKLVPESGLADALRAARVPANLHFAGGGDDLVFVEREMEGRHVYFLVNRSTEYRDASFVTPVKAGAERWNPMNGVRKSITAKAVEGGTLVPLMLEPNGSALIVMDAARAPGEFRDPQMIAELALPSNGWRLKVDGHVSAGAAYAKDIGVVSLGDWRGTEGLANFSGTGTYERKFRLPARWLVPGRQVQLKLGGVHDMATVSVNGRTFAPVITSPWLLDITPALKKGANRISVTIANVPQNAMVDAQKAGYKSLQSVPAGFEGPASLQLLETPANQ